MANLFGHPVVRIVLQLMALKDDIYSLAHESSLENGFSCPELTPKDAFGISDPHPKYADPSDCAKFYICLNGVTPREQGCELGLVYNELTQSCDSPKNVPEW